MLTALTDIALQLSIISMEISRGKVKLNLACKLVG
jgi:hypothetical protein